MGEVGGELLVEKPFGASHAHKLQEISQSAGWRRLLRWQEPRHFLTIPDDDKTLLAMVGSIQEVWKGAGGLSRRERACHAEQNSPKTGSRQ